MVASHRSRSVKCHTFPGPLPLGGLETYMTFQTIKAITAFYYINTNEIPGELSRENLISSHVKITCYLHV